MRFGNRQMSNLVKSSPNDDLGDLIFRCPKTGKDFISGFRADQPTIVHVVSKSARLRCGQWGELYVYKFAEARVLQR